MRAGPRPVRTASPLELTLRLVLARPWVLLAFAGTYLAIQGAALIPGLVERHVLDRIVSPGPPGVDLPAIVALLLAIGAARSLLQLVHGHAHASFFYGGASQMRLNAFASILDRPSARSLGLGVGDTMSRLRHDVSEVADFPLWIPYVAANLMLAVTAVAVMTRVDAALALLVITPSLAMVALGRLAWGHMLRYRRASRLATDSVVTLLLDTLTAAETVKGAGAEGGVLRQLGRLGAARRRATVADKVLEAGLESAYGLAVDLGIGLTLLLGGAAMVRGSFSAGDLALFASYLAAVARVPATVGVFIGDYRQQSVSIERLNEIVAPGSVLQLTDPVALAVAPSASGTAECGPALTTLELRDLSCRWPDGAGPDRVSLTLRRGTFTVVTGRVGSGKSTLLRAMLGLVAADGQLLWNGRVIEHPDRFMVPPRVGYVPQEPVLLAGTLREAILMGHEATDWQVLEAIRRAAMAPDLDQLEAGLETYIGSGGSRLSGGQLQRVAVARMLVRSPQLMLLDDISSALDAETEWLLWQGLMELSGSTVLAVSHRRSVLAMADMVVVLAGGRVVEVGRPGPVMASLANRHGRGGWLRE